MNALRLDASFSYIDPGNQTYSTPGKKFFFGFNYTYERADIDLTLEHIACLYGAVNYQKRLPDYTLLGAQVTYNATGYLQFLVTAENLFNASYQTIYGYPMPGRTLFAGLNLYLSSI
jgi:outer membrane cobalamin receptor